MGLRNLLSFLKSAITGFTRFQILSHQPWCCPSRMASSMRSVWIVREKHEFLLPGLDFLILLSDQPPTWDLLIDNTEPIFFYCTAEGSCLKEGMIGVINPVCKLPMRISSLETCADRIVERLYIFGNATIRGTSVHIHGSSWRQDPRRSRHYHQRCKPSNVVVKQILRISDPDINNSSNYDCNRGQFLPICSVSWERESHQIVFRCHCRNSRQWSSYRTLIGRFTLPVRRSHNNAPIHETTATFCSYGLSRREPYLTMTSTPQWHITPTLGRMRIKNMPPVEIPSS